MATWYNFLANGSFAPPLALDFLQAERSLVSNSRNRLFLVLVVVISLLPIMDTPQSSQAQVGSAQYQVATSRWRSADNRLVNWVRKGVALAPGGKLQLDPRTAVEGTDQYAPGKYQGGNFYNGGSFLVGEALGPVVMTAFPFSEAIPSWNAVTPPGTWIEVQLRAHISPRWTRWYNLGVWASGEDAPARHSVSDQADDKAYVDVDTLKLGTRSKPLTAIAYQVKFRLFSASRDALPSIVNAAVAVSSRPTAPAALAPGNPARWNKVLQVPECSQMIYPDGGEVWCSPTSMAMVLGFWEGRTGACEPAVRAAVGNLYDPIYRGYGNWPFNAAYAASRGLEAYVTRFTSMAQAEEWIAAGVPVVISFSWGRNQLTGAPIPTSSGHIAVLVGFDAKGNPIVNDPAAASNEAVQRTYSRSELEKLWLQGSGGTVYLIYPAGKAVPKL